MCFEIKNGKYTILTEFIHKNIFCRWLLVFGTLFFMFQTFQTYIHLKLRKIVTCKSLSVRLIFGTIESEIFLVSIIVFLLWKTNTFSLFILILSEITFANLVYCSNNSFDGGGEKKKLIEKRKHFHTNIVQRLVFYCVKTDLA